MTTAESSPSPLAVSLESPAAETAASQPEDNGSPESTSPGVEAEASDLPLSLAHGIFERVRRSPEMAESLLILIESRIAKHRLFTHEELLEFVTERWLALSPNESEGSSCAVHADSNSTRAVLFPAGNPEVENLNKKIKTLREDLEKEKARAKGLEQQMVKEKEGFEKQQVEREQVEFKLKDNLDEAKKTEQRLQTEISSAKTERDQAVLSFTSCQMQLDSMRPVFDAHWVFERLTATGGKLVNVLKGDGGPFELDTFLYRITNANTLVNVANTLSALGREGIVEDWHFELLKISIKAVNRCQDISTYKIIAPSPGVTYQKGSMLSIEVDSFPTVTRLIVPGLYKGDTVSTPALVATT